MATTGPSRQDLTEFVERIYVHIEFLEYDLANYIALYTEEAVVKVLNSAGGHLFGVDQLRRGDGMKLSIARLLDPAAQDKKGVKTNLTLDALVEYITPHTDGSFISHTESRITSLKTKLEPIKFERDKRIAHLDRAIALNGLVIGTEITLQELVDAVNEVAQIVDDVNNKLSLITHVSRDHARNNGQRDAQVLIRKLKAALSLPATQVLNLEQQYDSAPPS